eukprot:15349228-Ditylum_brightwellii.AAC.1
MMKVMRSARWLCLIISASAADIYGCGMTGVGPGFAGGAHGWPVTCQYLSSVITNPRCPCSPPPNVASTELAFSMSIQYISYNCWYVGSPLIHGMIVLGKPLAMSSTDGAVAAIVA